MSRTYASNDIITLPSLDAPSALSLASELITKSKLAKDPPATFVRSRKRLAERLGALQLAMKDRVGKGEAEPEMQREADRNLDSAWASINSALEAWARLPTLIETKKQTTARLLLGELFADGMKFLQLPYRVQWAESKTRIEHLDDDGLGPRLVSVVGETMVATLRQAQADYGKALGITTLASGGDDTAAVPLREPLDGLLAALRDYVLKASALADPDDAESEALVADLLAPVVGWQSRRKARNVGGEEAAPAGDGPGEPPGAPSAVK